MQYSPHCCQHPGIISRFYCVIFRYSVHFLWCGRRFLHALGIGDLYVSKLQFIDDSGNILLPFTSLALHLYVESYIFTDGSIHRFSYLSCPPFKRLKLYSKGNSNGLYLPSLACSLLYIYSHILRITWKDYIIPFIFHARRLCLSSYGLNITQKD